MSRATRRLLAGWDMRRLNRRDMEWLNRGEADPQVCVHCAEHRIAVAHAQYRRKQRGWR